MIHSENQIPTTAHWPLQLSALELQWISPLLELVQRLGGMNYSILITENCQPQYPFFFFYFHHSFSVGNVTLPHSPPSLSLRSSTIINAGFYFCRLYRRRRKETNKNCRRAEFTPDKQHPRGDLTLQFALTHRGKSRPYSDTFPVQAYFCKSIMQHKIAQTYIFPAAQSRRRAATKRQRCGRVFIENMNEGSTRLLCLLISPQG